MLELDCGQEFDRAREEEFFQALPARPGVVMFEMSAEHAQPHMTRTADVRRAAERLLKPPEAASKRLNLRDVAARVCYRRTGSKFEQTLALYENARRYLPTRYRDLLRLRPPAVLKVNLANDYPRCYATRRIRGDGGFYFGPFASRRLAEGFSEGFLDLFKIRRCQIRIRRDPTFPGCIYSEMKMCLAPCFAGCTREEYDAEGLSFVETLATRGDALTERIERERESASQELDFEKAATLHKRLEKVSGVFRGLPEIVRCIEAVDAVILQRAAEEKTVAVFAVCEGLLQDPIYLNFGELSSQPRSVEVILRQTLEAVKAPDPPADPAEAEENRANWRQRYGLSETPPQMPEHLALISRWFYSNPREGEILFREKDWPYRRILRACSRILAPPAAAPSAPS
jgi:excinuclease ABC subunit C